MALENLGPEDLANVTLRNLNDLEANERLPVVIFLGVLSVIGFIGNLHVIIVGICRLHTPSNYRIFITLLAVMDILNCLFGMPFEIFDNKYPYTFTYTTTCRVMRFHNTFVNIGSMLILLTIAVERYQKICKPLKTQMSKKRLGVACGIVVLISLVFSCPQAVFNGHRTVIFREQNITAKYNITGIDCTVSDEYKDTPFPRIYYIIINFGIIGSIVILTVLYCCVGQSLRKHTKSFGRLSAFRSSVSTECSNTSSRRGTLFSYENANEMPLNNLNGQCEFLPASNEIDDNNVISDKEDTDEVFLSDGMPTPRVHRKLDCQNSNDLDNLQSRDKINNTQKDNNRKPSFQRQFSNKSLFQRQLSSQPMLKRQFSNSEKTMIRTTRILCIITAIYIISYLPIEILIIINATKKGFFNHLDKTSKAIYKIFLRFFFINNVANPFIYGFYDKNFRKTCRKMYLQLFRILKCNYLFCKKK